MLYQVANRLGIVKALGVMRNGLLALWLVMARLIDQGSRLSAVRGTARQFAGDRLRVPDSLQKRSINLSRAITEIQNLLSGLRRPSQSLKNLNGYVKIKNIYVTEQQEKVVWFKKIKVKPQCYSVLSFGSHVEHPFYLMICD